MIDINIPIAHKDLDDEFLRKLFVLGKTHGWDSDYVEIKDFICSAYKMAGHIPPSDAEMEPFDIKDED